jgi:hypothetical protein
MSKQPTRKVVTYHIRHRLRRLRGNQFYLDRNPRETSTFCGAPVTCYDASWNSPAKPWKTHNSDEHPDGTPMVACSKCLAKR